MRLRKRDLGTTSALEAEYIAYPASSREATGLQQPQHNIEGQPGGHIGEPLPAFTDSQAPWRTSLLESPRLVLYTLVCAITAATFMHGESSSTTVNRNSNSAEILTKALLCEKHETRIRIGVGRSRTFCPVRELDPVCEREGFLRTRQIPCMAMDKKKQVGVKMHPYMQTTVEAANSTSGHTSEVLFAHTRV